MRIAIDLTTRLRDRIVGALHLGQVHSGDRLPSIREVADEWGVNARTVARAYRALHAEGLIEIRERSGIFVATQGRSGAEMLPETVSWMSTVLAEARRRRIPIPGFHDFVRRCTSAEGIRCAFVESSRDPMRAFCSDLDQGWGLEVTPVWITASGARGGAAGQRAVAQLRERIADCDIVTTTNYHATVVRAAAERLGRPAVVLTVHPETRSAIQRGVAEGGLTVVIADRDFGERLRVAYCEATGQPDRIRVVLAEDADAVAKLDPSEPVLLTRAAHELLGRHELRLLIPLSPTISPESDQELARVIIRINAASLAPS